MSRLALGAVQFGIAYGESEACLGEVGFQSFKVVTRLPAIPICCDDVSAWVQRQVDGSCARVVVGVESLDQLTQIVNAANLEQLMDFPDFLCNDEKLINPANWSQL